MATAKKETPKKTEDPSIEIINTEKCKTLSGKSTLTYHLGRGKTDDLLIRIYSNTNEGFFSNEWISLNAILGILEKQGTDLSFTSFLFSGLYRGLSVNTPGFLVAALLNEKVLVLEKGKQRKYLFSSAAALLAKIDKANTAKAAKKTDGKSSK